MSGYNGYNGSATSQPTTPNMGAYNGGAATSQPTTPGMGAYNGSNGYGANGAQAPAAGAGVPGQPVAGVPGTAPAGTAPLGISRTTQGIAPLQSPGYPGTNSCALTAVSGLPAPAYAIPACTTTPAATAVTFTVLPGELTITVPTGPIDCGEFTAGTTAYCDLAIVTVADGRGTAAAGTWTASAGTSTFIPQGGLATALSPTIPATDVTYNTGAPTIVQPSPVGTATVGGGTATAPGTPSTIPYQTTFTTACPTWTTSPTLPPPTAPAGCLVPVLSSASATAAYEVDWTPRVYIRIPANAAVTVAPGTDYYSGTIYHSVA